MTSTRRNTYIMDYITHSLHTVPYFLTLQLVESVCRFVGDEWIMAAAAPSVFVFTHVMIVAASIVRGRAVAAHLDGCATGSPVKQRDGSGYATG